MHIFSSSALMLALVATSSVTRTFTLDFNGVNEGDWRIHLGGDIAPTGGNGGAFLFNPDVRSSLPRIRTTAPGAVFGGDYRARNVSDLGLDLNVLDLIIDVPEGMKMHLMLVHDNGTPDEPRDDTGAFVSGRSVPQRFTGWHAVDFHVPSDSDALPPGWSLVNLGDLDLPPFHSWSQVIRNVGRVEFRLGRPGSFSFNLPWDLGVDNVRITHETCGADFDGDRAVGIADFLDVLAEWGPCSGFCESDLDGDGAIGIAEFMAVLGQWGECP